MKHLTGVPFYVLALLILCLSLTMTPHVMAQIQQGNGLISAWNGLGRTTCKCVDRDADGYGDGPKAILVTTSTSATVVGTVTLPLATISGTFLGTINGTNQVTFPAGIFAGSYDFQVGEKISGTGIPAGTFIDNPTVLNSQLTLTQAATATGTFVFTVTITTGSVLSVGTGPVMEKAIVSAISGNNVTTTLIYPHPLGSMVKTQGCAGPDGDDWDPLRWTWGNGSDGQLKQLWGTIPAFMAHRGFNLSHDNPIPGDAASAAGILAAYQTPHAIWYVAPSPAIAPNTVAGSNSNSCTTEASPCLNQDGLNSKGYTSGDMIVARQGWNNAGASQAFNPANGTSSLYTSLVSYPGERMVLDGSFGSASGVNLVGPYHDLIFDGMIIQNGASVSGGTIDGTGHVNNNDILFEGINGGNGGSGISSMSMFNGLQYITIQDSILHDNDCAGGGCQHGIYWGCRDVACSFITYRRSIAYGNDSNGFTFNGRCTSCVFSQLISFSNGISGVTLEMGVSNSTYNDILMFSNANNGLTIFNYPGDCPSQGGTGNICPYNQTGNTFENITIYQTGNANLANANNGAGSCPTNISYCGQSGIAVANTTSPLTGNLGSNTYRNIFVSSYGYVNHYPPIIFEDTVASCGTSCLSWLSTSTFNNVTSFQTDGQTSVATQGIFGFGPGSFGFVPYTCAQAASHTTLTNCNVADPLFITEGLSLWNVESNYDFRLSSTSPLIGAGTTTGVPAYDLTGVPFATTPSIGTLEVAPNFVWTNFTAPTIASVVAPVGGAQYSATATASSGTATLTLSGPYFTAHGNQAISQQQVYVTGCSVAAYNTTGTSITAFTANTISYPVTGSPVAATGCVVGESIDGSAEGNGNFAICPTCTPYNYPGVVNRFVSSWGSAVMTNGHTMVGGGGGHSDSGNNQFYSFNLANNTISMLNVPSVITALQWNAFPVFYKNNDGSYASRHMFGGLTYIPTTNKIFELGGGPYGNVGSPAYFGDTWLIDPATGIGTQQDPVNCPTTCGGSLGGYTNPFSATGNSGIAPFVINAYDPNTQTVFSIVNPSNGYMLQYTPCTGSNASVCNSYKIVSNSVAASGCATVNTCQTTFVDDVHKNLWVFGGSQAHYWTIGNATPTQVDPIIDSSCNTVFNAAAPGIVWDHNNVMARIYAGIGGDQTVWNFDPATGSCTVSSYGGAVPPVTSNANGTFGRWQYDATFNEFVWIGDTNTGVSILGPQTGCHIVPTSLPNGTVGVPYSQTFTEVSCSTGTWSTSGLLPTGISGCSGGSGATCTISGTPLDSGVFNFNVSYSTASNPITVTILPGVTNKLFLPTLIK